MNFEFQKNRKSIQQAAKDFPEREYFPEIIERDC